MGRGTSLGYLPPLVKCSASGARVGWEVLCDQWRGMAFCKSHKGCAVNCRVLSVAQLTVFEEGGELKS